MKYRDEIEKKYILKLRKLEKELPDFVSDFFRSIGEITSIKTRVNYAYDLKIFFTYLIENCKYFKDISIDEIDYSIMSKIKVTDLEKFLEYLSYYIKVDNNGKSIEMQNRERGKSRKLAAVRRLFKYLYKLEKITSNPCQLVEAPKIHDKEITILEPNEISAFLDEVENGSKLTERQKKWHEHTKIRDLAIVTLLLGTGIRVSECVGININDIDFNINGIRITRKGGKEATIYFNSEVFDALNSYIDIRENIQAIKGHENALFLSLQKKRITDRSVENIIKKYSKCVIKLKNISPHKLRSTFGTSLYMKTGDIYLVADALGHEDVNTTKKHYAKMSDSNRRKAATFVKLREN